MLNSMTGFGAAAADDHGISCAVEIRSVNNRFFKAVIKLPDKLAMLEPEIDKVLRESIVRGSIVLAISVRDEASATSVTINQRVLDSYVEQVKKLQERFGMEHRVDITGLLNLPGVVEAGDDSLQ